MITKAWVGFSTPAARSIVRAVLTGSSAPSDGLTTHEIFRAAHAQFPDARLEGPPDQQRLVEDKKRVEKQSSMVPEAEHIIKSVGYLKRTVLADMAERREVQKIVVRGRIPPPATLVEPPPTQPEQRESLSEMTWVWRLLERGEQAVDLPEVRRPEPKAPKLQARMREAFRLRKPMRKLETPDEFRLKVPESGRKIWERRTSNVNH